MVSFLIEKKNGLQHLAERIHLSESVIQWMGLFSSFKLEKKTQWKRSELRISSARPLPQLQQRHLTPEQARHYADGKMRVHGDCARQGC
jgi:hypothetical protein